MRYLSVDFYRGLTVAFMIIVNTPGTGAYVFPPLQHALWHGCTPTDLVFPSFMFIIGVSMWFAFTKYEHQWSAELGRKILRRTALLFLIGLILNHFPILWKDWGTWRIMGVPQRLALGYGIGSVLALRLNQRWLIGISAFFLLLYWALLYAFGMPGADPYALETNAVLRLDRWLFTDAHLYHGEGIGFDPEGVLSTIPSVVTVLLGWMCGRMLTRMNDRKMELVRQLLLLGVMCGVAGLLWDQAFPINKKLWTSSYVLYAGGLSILLLAVSVWLFDVRNWRKGAGFFLTFGSNALFAYVLSEALVMILYTIRWTDAAGRQLSAQEWIYQTIFQPLNGAEWGSFAFAIAYMLLCWAICRPLYLRKIYIKL